VDDTKPSKSARKREYLALQKLGEELITIRESDLQSMPLDEDLLEAIMETRRIKSHGALRRQKQYIGKLMRHVDPEPINAALERLRRKS
jgi:ribosome-associated protein